MVGHGVKKNMPILMVHMDPKSWSSVLEMPE